MKQNILFRNVNSDGVYLKNQKAESTTIISATNIFGNIAVYLTVLIMIFLVVLPDASSAPSGPTITYNQTYNYTPQQAAEIRTAGGSFTTIVLNATTQTPRWKAYVGNVSGKLALDDVGSKSIFDWTLASVTGEVYATRNTSINWAGIQCADIDAINTEEYSLNMSSSNVDTINKTFAQQIHTGFYVGTVPIANSTCRSIATYINDAAQAASEAAKFQEILLMDNADKMVYATLINHNTTGFNGDKYDFQMIVPENEFQSTPSTYYLYVELI